MYYYYPCPLSRGMLSHEDTKQCIKILLSTEADVDQAWATPLCCSDQGLDPWFWFQVQDPCSFTVSSLQSLSPVQLFVTPWTAAHQASLSIINSRSLLKLMFIELAMPSNHLILRCPLFLLPSIFHIIRVFSNESVLCHQVAKILELQHQSFQWIFRTDFL